MSPGSCLLEAGRGPEDSPLFPSASYYVESDRQPFLGEATGYACGGLSREVEGPCQRREPGPGLHLLATYPLGILADWEGRHRHSGRKQQVVGTCEPSTVLQAKAGVEDDLE